MVTPQKITRADLVALASKLPPGSHKQILQRLATVCAEGAEVKISAALFSECVAQVEKISQPRTKKDKATGNDAIVSGQSGPELET